MSRRAVVFGSRLSPFVEKVVRALAFKGMPFDLVPVKSPLDFGRWNPQTKKMPVVDLDGERLYDSTFIVRRLDEIAPEPGLIARDRETAAAQHHLEDWSDESLYWYAMALRWSPQNTPATTAQITADLAAPFRLIASVVLPRRIRSTTRAQGLGRLPGEIVLRELARHLDDLATMLADRPFFFADEPSVADLAIYGQCRMLASGPTPEAAALIVERPKLAGHMRRVEEVARVPPSASTGKSPSVFNHGG